jgi:hypothetical protein
MVNRQDITRNYLVASDFDQTLSFNDSGIVLRELLGADGFQEKVAGLSGIHLVQQGAELAYLLRTTRSYAPPGASISPRSVNGSV